MATTTSKRPSMSDNDDNHVVTPREKMKHWGITDRTAKDYPGLFDLGPKDKRPAAKKPAVKRKKKRTASSGRGQ